MGSILTKKELREIDFSLSRDARVAAYVRRKRDPYNMAKEYLLDCGEDLRDWPPKRIAGLIREGFLNPEDTEGVFCGDGND